GAIDLGISLAAEGDHSRSFCSSPEEAFGAGARQGSLAGARRIERTVDQAGLAEDHTVPVDRDEVDQLGDARLEADAGPRRLVELLAPGSGAVEFERAVRLE